jgi:hypothetical protein
MSIRILEQKKTDIFEWIISQGKHKPLKSFSWFACVMREVYLAYQIEVV